MKSSTARFLALDMFRGIAIASMILVNTPGDWGHVYSSLLHSSWHGLTPADIVFPCFLFIVGASIFFAFRASNFTLSPASFAKIVKRSALMFAIGFSLNIYNMLLLDTDSVRIMGVLQRISLCYFLGALIALSFQITTVYLICGATLSAYYALFVLLGGDSPFSLEHNIVALIDRSILGDSQMWKMNGISFDPEGILSTLPATVTLLLGFETTRILTRCTNTRSALKHLVFLSLGLLLVGWGVSFYMPINKNIWSASFVLVSGGLAVLILALCVCCSDILKLSTICEPLKIYGTNPLLIYCLSWMLATGLMALKLSLLGASSTESAYSWLWQLLLPFMPPKLASLLFALAHVLLFWLLALWLYRRNFILKL